MDQTMPMSDAFAILFTGLVIVFAGLVLLIIFVSLISFLLKRSKQNETPSAPIKQAVKVPAAAPVPAPVIEDGISDEIVAVITAAIASMSSGSEAPAYAIRGIKKVKTGRPVWASAGLQENTRAF